MSVRVESPPIRGSFNGPIVFAIIVALGIGIFAGTVVTKAVQDRPAAVATVGTPLSVAQDLQEMQGDVLGARFRAASQPVGWDTLTLEAMAGRVLYQPVATPPEGATTAKPSSTRPPIEGWDAYKLNAMEGRVLAAQVGAEDPPVKPHLPKRSPNG